MTVSLDWQRNIIELGRFGRRGGRAVTRDIDCGPDAGIRRPEGCLAMTAAREYLVREMILAGLEVSRDYAGNLYGRCPGRGQAKAVLCGSHLDTVINGGQFDGAYGIVAALEVLRRMRSEGFNNRRPLEMVAFMGEEGSCFNQTLLGSAALAGIISRESLESKAAADGRPFREIAGGWNMPESEKDIDDYEYFIEAHIEQGPVLWTEKQRIGCVHGIAGLFYLKLAIEGEGNHAGSTPMRLRRDPVIPMAEITLFARQAAEEQARSNGCAVATVDAVSLRSGAPGVIPESISLGIDIRDARREDILTLRDRILDFAYHCGCRHGCRVEAAAAVELDPASLNGEVVAVINQAAEEAGFPARPIFSGAVHDALNISRRVKTGMIFVPSVDGRSHSPYEWTDWEDLAAGIDVLAETVKTLCR